jgi:hypothetical protein
MELGQPDSAYRHYCATACDTHYRAQKPKALYSASWIARYSLKDSVRADSLYKLLLFGFPSNVYAQKAQEARGDKKTVFTRRDSAQASFQVAENIFFDNEKPDSAAEAYIDVYKKFPETEYGPQSLYAAAWIYDNVLDKNRTAKGIYELLCDSFPKCSYCVNEAKPRLKTVADSLAAMRNRRKSISTPAPGSHAQAPVSVSKSPTDSALPLLSDKDSSARRAFQPGGPPPGYSRGYYRGMPPQIPPSSARPDSTLRPVVSPTSTPTSDTSKHTAASLTAAPAPVSVQSVAAPPDSLARKAVLSSMPPSSVDTSKHSTPSPTVVPAGAPMDTSKHIVPSPGDTTSNPIKAPSPPK